LKEYVLEANVLVHFLTKDQPHQARAAAALLHEAEAGEACLHLDPVIIAEALYVLTAYYKLPKASVVDALISLMGNRGIKVEAEETLSIALSRYRQAEGIDFFEAWLVARGVSLRLPVAAFDRNLDNFKEITRYELRA